MAERELLAKPQQSVRRDLGIDEEDVAFRYLITGSRFQLREQRAESGTVFGDKRCERVTEIQKAEDRIGDGLVASAKNQIERISRQRSHEHIDEEYFHARCPWLQELLPAG